MPIAEIANLAVQAIPAVMGLFGKKKSATTTSTQNIDINTDTSSMTAEQRDQFQNILSGLSERFGSGNFSKEQAIADATQVSDIASQKILSQIPQTVSQATSGGAYSSTGVQSVINDLAGQATAVKAKTIMDTINQYAAQDMQQNAQLLSAFGLAGESTKSEKKKGTVVTETKGPAGAVAQTSMDALGSLVGKGVDAYSQYAQGKTQAEKTSNPGTP